MVHENNRIKVGTPKFNFKMKIQRRVYFALNKVKGENF